MRFIRKNGRVIPINEGASKPMQHTGEHPSNTKLIDSLAKEHGVSRDKIKSVADTRGITFKKKLGPDEQGELEQHAERAFGGHADAPKKSGAGKAAVKVVAGAGVAAAGGHMFGQSIKAGLGFKKRAAEDNYVAAMLKTNEGKVLANSLGVMRDKSTTAAQEMSKLFAKSAQSSAAKATKVLNNGYRALRVGKVVGAGLIGAGTNKLLDNTRLKDSPKTKAVVATGAAIGAGVISELAFRRSVGGPLMAKKLLTNAIMRGFRKRPR